ncbi:hypothetical protein ASPU41_21325 (plasmid) [Arthrobacter sp. U41]|nr:hypothetical protein ASPU41_21325 [Arthrobacter sp. U41]
MPSARKSASWASRSCHRDSSAAALAFPADSGTRGEAVTVRRGARFLLLLRGLEPGVLAPGDDQVIPDGGRLGTDQLSDALPAQPGPRPERAVTALSMIEPILGPTASPRTGQQRGSQQGWGYWVRRRAP